MNPETPFSRLALQELRIAADARGHRLEVIEIRSADKLATAVVAAARAEAKGLLPVEDPLLLSLRRQMADLATRARLPIIAGNREFAEAGGLLSYGTDRRHLYRRAADFADKILKGTKPADIPVEQPTKFELVLNLRTAKTLGLEVPPTLLARADEVIE
jgi:putative ABC transport system substrate-binding protein